MPVLDENSRATIARLRKAAESPLGDKLSLADVLTQRLLSSSQFADIVIDGVTWFIGYGIEQQLIARGEQIEDCLCRHLSISHPDREALPGIEATQVISEQFGIDLHKAQVSVAIYPKRGMTAQILQVVSIDSIRVDKNQPSLCTGNRDKS